MNELKGSFNKYSDFHTKHSAGDLRAQKPQVTQIFSQEAELQRCMSCDKGLASEERLLAKSTLKCQKKDVLWSEAAPVMAQKPFLLVC